MINVPRETRARLSLLGQLVLDENMRQNLISAGTADDIETRHIADSLQLLRHVPAGVLVDIGTGAGFPGLVIACCRREATHLVEPRSKRAAFLQRAIEHLGIADWTTVWPCKVERIALDGVRAITARAVAPLETLFEIAEPIASAATHWVLPKGRHAQTELDTARRTWQGDFQLVPSATEADSWIVLADNVSRRRKA